MITYLFNKLKGLAIALLLILTFAASSWGQTWDGGAGTNNWGDGNNWNPNGVPLAGGAVTIGSGYTVVVNGTFSCASLTLSANAANTTLNFNTGSQLTITGAITFNNPSADNRNQTINVYDGTLICGSITMANCTNGGLRTNNLNISTGTATVNGNITTNGVANENYVNITDAGTLNLGGAFAGGTFNISGTGSTVKWFDDGTNFRSGVNYHHLILQLPTSAAAIRVKAMTAATTVGGNLTIESLHATRTLTFNPAGFDLTVNGTTTINARGILNDNTNAGTNRFDGLVTIAANGQFINTNNPVYEFRGGITNNGTFTKSGTGAVTFSTNSQIISGSSALTFSGGDIIISNPASIDVSTDISYSGTNFTNNSNATPAFNVTAGTFTFLPNAAQSIGGAGTGTVTFYNLTCAGGNTKTANRQFDVANNLTVNTGVTLALGFGTASTYNIGGNVALNGTGTFNLGTVANIINITGDATVAGSIVFSTGVAKTVNLTGNLSGGGTVNMSGGNLAHRLNLGGATNAITTFTSGTGSIVTYNRSGNQTVFGGALANLTISGSGNKSLQGAITIAATGTLTLNSGVLQLGNNNLTLNNNAVTAVQGTPSGASMVETNGNGYVIRNAAATVPILFPIGTNGLYTPATISSTNPTTGTISARTAFNDLLGAKYVQRYWDLLTSAAGPYTITATFQYDISEITTSPTFIKYRPNAGVWQNPIGTASFGANSFTITGTTNVTNAVSSWTAGAIGTFYSYQTGDWNTPTTWTSDPGGTTQVGTTVPQNNDVVVILSGRTVSLPANITTTGLDVTINAGGFLNLATYQFTNPLLALRGKGTLQLASATFPTVTTNTFINAGEGTVEYNNAANFNLPAQATYNNLTINAPGVIATQLNNTLTLNGNLYVKAGTYRINDNTAARRQLLISGNVTVENGASLTVGTGVTNTVTSPLGISGGIAPFINYYDSHSHRVVINGDFTNNGTVRFTNLTYPVFNAFPPTVLGATTGFATVYFRGATNNTLTCNNTTDFYNLVLDKGVDQTYALTVYSSAYPNFRLFGANIAGGDTPGANPNLKKALWIRTGTLKLQGLTIIPSLSEGTCAAEAAPSGNPNSDFYIPANGSLVLDGPDVIVLSTADDYREVNLAYNVAGGTGLVNGVGHGGCSSYSIYGKLQINNGYFSTRESGGFITWDLAAGQFIINGGTVDAKQFRAAGGSGGLSSYAQTGGLFILRGRFWRTPTAYTAISNLTDFSTATLNTARSAASIEAGKGAFNLNSAANVFGMTGGTIRVYDVMGNAAAEQKAFEVLSSAGNINVTGGTLEIVPTTGTLIADPANYYIETTAKIANLTINRASGAAVVGLRTYPLTVLTNLILTSGDFNANSLDVIIGRDFTISAGTTYTTGTNRTIFNGGGTQYLTFDIAVPLTLNKLVLDKPNASLFRLAGTQNTLNITDSLKILEARFFDQFKTVNCYGNVYNSGTHFGSGKIVLAGDASLSIDGDGTGIFQNIELNKPAAGVADVTVNSNITVNGVLRFTGAATGYKKLNLQEYNLLMGASASVLGADANRFVYTKGEVGNASISKIYSTTATTFTFPIGAQSTRHIGVPEYTPATISFTSDPTTYGTVTVVPVGAEHFATNPKNRSLTYYWRTKSDGFVGVQTGSVNHSYTYSLTDNDVVTGGDVTESGYVPARFDNATVSWTNGTTASINTTTNVIDGPWLSGVDYVDGDYTAGDVDATNPFGAPLTYYSYNSGWWGNPANWSLSGHTIFDPPAVAPGASDIVVIGNNHTIALNTNNTNPNTDARSCASLQIEAGATLDIGYNPNSNFTVVASHPNGNGLIRLTTNFNTGYYFTFPTGDFSDFNVNLGTTELYSTNPGIGTTYWLPNNISKYGNLTISPLGGSNIIFGNTDVLIYGNCTIQGQNADSWFCPTWNTNYPDPNDPTSFNIPRISKTITVNGNMDIQGGSFGWLGGGAGGVQNVVVHGNITVASGAGINVWQSNTSQTLSIGGNLINNANNIINAGATCRSYVCLNVVPVIFFGNTNATVFTANNTAYAGNQGTGNGWTDPAAPLHRSATIFGNVTVNKGTSQATTLSFTGGNISTPVNGWLTLQNGTLRYLLTDPRTNFTVSTTTAFTIPGTSGLEINLTSNANNTNVLIANANANNNDLFLNGKLTIANSTVYVGPAASTAFNNDIEYGGGGLSEIDMQGGTLVVNGQIRMSAASTAGVLKYRQSGSSSVIINGQAADNTKAKLEIYNPGSVFQMSGSSSLYIVRGGGGATYGDLYLRAATSSASGTSTITFSQYSPFGLQVDLPQNYLLDANIPLNNLTITGKTAATARNATVTLLISPLVMNGDLTISNANSILDANSAFSINVNVKGGFTNNGTYNHYNNITTFSGGTQTIGGTSVTNFYNLVVNPVTSLSLIRNITVLNDLTLSSGQLLYSTFSVNVKRHITNNANYDGDAVVGGVILNGAVQQEVSGTGTFGRLELDNANGAMVYDNITLQKNIRLTTGVFNINQHLITLGVNSEIEGSGFGPTKMIASDGVYSNVGLRKYFPIYHGIEKTFRYPMGTSNKFTPADLSYTDNNNVGYVRINNINDNHPGVIDPNNVLDYFWEVESSGIEGFNGKLVLNYLEEDVVVSGNTESDYIPAALLIPGSSWSKYSSTNINTTANTITFNFSAQNSLSAEYTAGVDPALPNTVPEFTSINSGLWFDKDNWVQTGGDPYVLTGAPNGFIVIIDADDEVTIDNDYASAYRTTIKGKLINSPTNFGHNLGDVSGNGTLFLQSSTFPAGRYNSFFDCTNNGILEFGGTTNYNVVADLFSTLPRLHFSGTGSRMLPNKNLTICKRLLINGPTVDNSLNNRKLTIQGTMERLAGTFTCGSGAGAIVSFAGSSAQTIGGALGNFTGANSFNHFEINNSSGLTINNTGAIAVAGNLLLTSGNITTSSTATLTITNTAINCVTPSGGKVTSFVNGPLTKRINQGDNFIFPVGKGTELGNKISLSSTQTGTILWTVEYFTPNPTYTSQTAPLTYVNSKEYWTVSAPSGSQAVVNLNWDPASDLTPLMTENGLSDMRVAVYNTGTTSWEEITSLSSGDESNGKVYTSSRVTIPAAGSSNYTIACINITKPRARFNPPVAPGSVCGDAGIPVVFSGVTGLNLNFILNYKKGGFVQAPITVNSLPFTLPTDVTGNTYQLISFTYDNPPHSAPVQTGVVDATIVTTYTIPTTAIAGLDQSICGATTATLDANTPAIGTGLWSVTEPGGTVVFPTVPTSQFNGTNGSTYNLTWTISNGGCTSSDNVVISFPLLPEKPNAFVAYDDIVCQGDIDVPYSVSVTGPHTFTWNYTGTNATIDGSGAAITIDYNNNATSGTLSVYTTNGCGNSAPLNLNVTVNTRPVFTVLGSSDDICHGELYTLTTSFTSINPPYNIDIILDGSSVAGSPFSSSNNPDYVYTNNLLWSVGAVPSTPYSYSVTVIDNNGCTSSTLVPITVDVWKIPETGPQYHIPN